MIGANNKYQTWKNFPSAVKAAWFILSVYIFIAVFSPFIANEKPILIKNEDGLSMPIFMNKSIEYYEAEILISPIIPYSYKQTNLTQNKALAPLTYDDNDNIHLLGTDGLGRDLTASLIRGAFISLKIAGIATILALLLGLLIGATIAYVGDTKIMYNAVQLIILTFSKIYVLYLIAAKFFFANDNYSTTSFAFSIVLIAIVSLLAFNFASKLRLKKYQIPCDTIGMRAIEIINSLPGLFIILFIMSLVSGGSVSILIITLSILILPNLVRHSRAETLAIKGENFVQTAESIGQYKAIIIIKHIIPNIIQPILVITIFGFMACILTESSLSFLGIGLPIDEMSWGKLLSQARSNLNAWWLAVFPGLALFKVIWALHTLREYYAER